MRSAVDWAEIFEAYTPLCIRYAANEMVSQRGSYVAGIHLVVRGAISERRPHDGSSTAAVLLGPGDFVGLESLEDHSESLARAQTRAVTEVELLFLETHRFRAALCDDSARQMEMIRYLASRALRTQEERSWACGEGKQRVARLLLQLSQMCDCSVVEGDAEWLRCPAEISIRTLCDLAGVSARGWRQTCRTLEGVRLGAEGVEFHQARLAHCYNVSSMIDR